MLMIIVGQVSNKQEAMEIKMIAKMSIVAQRARFLGRQINEKSN